MPRRRVNVDEVRSDRWVISYADFITLLFAFFVVMYAISSVNEEKYKQVADSLSGIFTGPDGSAQRPVDGRAEKDPQGIGVYAGGEANNTTPTVKIVPPNARNSASLKEIGGQMEVQFKKLIRDGHVAVQSNNLWVAIEMGANLLFPEGGALPAITADPVFERLARILKGYPNPIHVEGFTDNQLISTDQFPSNWELSAARAAGVVRILEINGIQPQRMSAVGFGEYQPLESNFTEQGRQINRRIVIVVSRDRKTQRVVSAFGSQQVSEDAVSGILANEDLPDSAIEKVVTEDGQVLFRRKDGAERLDLETVRDTDLNIEPVPQGENQ